MMGIDTYSCVMLMDITNPSLAEITNLLLAFKSQQQNPDNKSVLNLRSIIGGLSFTCERRKIALVCL